MGAFKPPVHTVMWEGFFTGYLNYGLNCREKNEEIISRNSLPHYKRASYFTNKREAAWLHLLLNLSRYRRMSESVQHAGSAHHSTTGDIYCMRAVPVTPRWRVKATGLYLAGQMARKATRMNASKFSKTRSCKEFTGEEKESKRGNYWGQLWRDKIRERGDVWN